MNRYDDTDIFEILRHIFTIVLPISPARNNIQGKGQALTLCIHVDTIISAHKTGGSQQSHSLGSINSRREICILWIEVRLIGWKNQASRVRWRLKACLSLYKKALMINRQT